MNFTIFSSLNSRVPNFADLLRIELRPFLIVKFLKKRKNRAQINKIDKSISYIAVVFKVDWKIKKIKGIFKLFIQQLQHQLFGVFVGYVPNHARGLLALVNVFGVDAKFLVVFYGKVFPFPLFLRFLI